MEENYPQFDTFTIKKNVNTNELTFIFQSPKAEQIYTISEEYNNLYKIYRALTSIMDDVVWSNNCILENTNEYIIKAHFEFSTTKSYKKDFGMEMVDSTDLGILITKTIKHVVDDETIIGEFMRPNMTMSDVYALLSAICPIESTHTTCSLTEIVSQYTTTLYSREKTE